MQWMRCGWTAAVCFSLLAMNVPARALADGESPDDLKKMYQDTLVQLKASQDRKNELSKENEQLIARVKELEAQLDSAKRESADVADKTFVLRSRNAAFDAFLKRYPKLLECWKAWLENDAGFKAGTLPATTQSSDWPFDTTAR